MDKKALRREIGAKKRALSAAEIEARSAVLAKMLYATEQYRAARSLYAYLSFNQEVRTDPIIERAWADGKRVAVPKVVGDEMVFIWIDSFEGLTPQGAFHIMEPIEDGPIADDGTALILMPGLAFDPQGHRVGYGGGYYDAFVSEYPNIYTIALAYEEIIVDHLPLMKHDLTVDLIVTEERTVLCNG